MKILLADDHAVVRQGLKLILTDHFKKAEFGEARNANEVLTADRKSMGRSYSGHHHAWPERSRSAPRCPSDSAEAAGAGLEHAS
jgi:hypothetical protein